MKALLIAVLLLLTACTPNEDLKKENNSLKEQLSLSDQYRDLATYYEVCSERWIFCLATEKSLSIGKMASEKDFITQPKLAESLRFWSWVRLLSLTTISLVCLLVLIFKGAFAWDEEKNAKIKAEINQNQEKLIDLNNALARKAHEASQELRDRLQKLRYETREVEERYDEATVTLLRLEASKARLLAQNQELEEANIEAQKRFDALN